MVDLCAKLPIYRVAKGDLNPNNMKQTNDAVQNADEAQVSAQRKYKSESNISELPDC